MFSRLVSGALLAASHGADDTSHARNFPGVLAATYVLWFAGLRVNLIANWRLLEQTGISTNLLSTSMFELARCCSSSQRAACVASAVVVTSRNGDRQGGSLLRWSVRHGVAQRFG